MLIVELSSIRAAKLFSLVFYGSIPLQFHSWNAFIVLLNFPLVKITGEYKRVL
jgi:hypothetical protein